MGQLNRVAPESSVFRAGGSLSSRPPTGTLIGLLQDVPTAW
jgi:hypothetical protein